MRAMPKGAGNEAEPNRNVSALVEKFRPCRVGFEVSSIRTRQGATRNKMAAWRLDLPLERAGEYLLRSTALEGRPLGRASTEDTNARNTAAKVASNEGSEEAISINDDYLMMYGRIESGR